MIEQVEENGFDLLDLLGIVAENLKLLIVGPILVGMIGLGVSYTLPKSFASRSILSLPTSAQFGNARMPPPPTATQVASTLLTPVVLDPVIAAFNLAEGKPLQAARLELSKRIKTVVGKDSFLSLDVTASSPAEAQATANAVLDAWLKSTSLGSRDLDSLTKRLNYAKSSIESVRRQLARLASSEGTGRNVGARDDPVVSMIALSELESRFATEILNLEKSIEGLSRDVLVQEPTLPLEPASPNKKLIAVGSALLCAFLLFLWVVIKNLWIVSAQNPIRAKKQGRLLRALGFKHKVGEV